MTELKQYRLAKGMTQQKLAAEIGVDKATVCRWERGHSTPEAATYPNLARVLGVDALHLAQLFAPSHRISEPSAA